MAGKLSCASKAGTPAFLLEQPVLGIAGCAVVVPASLLFTTLLPPPWVNGWVALVFNAMVPALIVQTTVWRGAPVALDRQPLRGAAGLATVWMFGSAAILWAIWAFGGGGIRPSPYVIMPLISAVPIVLWQVFLFECWPYPRLVSSSMIVGLLVLATTYGVVTACVHLFFNYAFLDSAVLYSKALDPGGLFDARVVVAILVASAGGVLALLALDFWPITMLAKSCPAVSRQPWRGSAGLALVLYASIGLWALCVEWWGMDLAEFQARACVSFIFGMFVLVVMLEGSLFSGRPQPSKGLLRIGSAAMIAIAAYALYRVTATRLRGMTDLSPAHELETWISTVMLAITFPGMAVLADLFGFWPLRRNR